MGECLITRRGGESLTLPILNDDYPKDKSITFISGNTATATFDARVATEGNPPSYTYQWYLDDNAVSGANSSTYTWSGNESGTHTVYCTVTNKAGTVSTRVATLNVEKYYLPVLNSSYPANLSCMTSNGTATFEVKIATDGNPSSYTYQWYWDGAALSWATGSTVTVSLAHGESIHTLYCNVTNAAGTVQSRVATLTLRNTYLYNGAETNTDITGGFTLGGAIPNSEYTLGSFSKSGKLYLDLNAWSSCLHGFVTTVNPVDLTHYSKIRFTVCQSYTSYWQEPWRIGASSSKSYAQNYAVAVSTVYVTQDATDYSIRTYDVDISGISGSYYVGFWLWFYYDATHLGVSAIQLIL